MKKRMSLICLLLAFSMLLCACNFGVRDFYRDLLMEAIGSDNIGKVSYSDMEYTRPDMIALEKTVTNSCEIARTSSDIDEVLDAVYTYYDSYDGFYTNMNLAYLKYCADLRDVYWEKEYNYCAENAGTVDAGLEELYYALADSPIREELEGEAYFGAGFFDAYEGENVWDDTFLGLLEEETQLVNQYYELIEQQEMEDPEAFYTASYEEMAQLLVDLVAKRQEIAAYMGYDSYVDFAYGFYYYRDYTPAQAMELTEIIRQELVEPYRAMSEGDYWAPAEKFCTQSQMNEYMKVCADAMGGDVKEAYARMQNNGLWNTEPGEYKLNTSFEVFLVNYQSPFVFVNPTETDYDKLVLAHEFGHFVHDFVCGGTYASADVAEVLSQGMEYMSLCYGENTQALARMKAAETLSVYVEQAAYAAFEHQLYELPSEALTVENVHALYRQVGLDFGFDTWEWDSRDFVLVNHYYTDPMYIISYVVSNDIAFQLYQLELEQPGAGLEKYQQMLFTNESWFCTFVEDMGMELPFDVERIRAAGETLQEIMK